jgi:TonB family protein
MMRVPLFLAGYLFAGVVAAQTETFISDELPTLNDPDASIVCPPGTIKRTKANTFRELDPVRLADAKAHPSPGHVPAKMLAIPSLKYPGNLFSRKPGFASVFIIVDANGKPIEPQIVCSSGEKYERASIEAILAAKFSPSTLDGVAIEDGATVPFDFKIP